MCGQKRCDDDQNKRWLEKQNMLCGVKQLVLPSKVSTGHLVTLAGHQRSVARRLIERFSVQDSVRTHNSSVVSSLCPVSSAPISTFEKVQ